jgi:Lrp/AsnC family transcriptional regulator
MPHLESFMDAIDRKILTLMQAHPDLSVLELSELVGLSHSPCWRRLKRLEAEGFIRGRALLLDPVALGLTVNVFAHLKLRQHDESTLEAFESAARDRPEIVECFSMSGESDYVLRIVIRNIDGYEKFLKKVLLHLPSVASVNSSFALKCVKLTTQLPVDGL